MANELLYWIGKGTIFINAKPHDKNKPIPIKEVPKDFIDRHVKLGNIGAKISNVEIVSKSLKDENESLKKEIKSLKAESKPKDAKLKKDLKEVK